jgi:hypothetical protein
MSGVPGVCHHCHCPASHFLRPSSNCSLKQGKAIFRTVVEVAAKLRQHIGLDVEGKRKWQGSQLAYSVAMAEAGGVHLMFNALHGIIHQGSQQQVIFVVLHGMKKGVLPFTVCASMTMCITVEESIGCKGVTMRWIEQRMQNLAGPDYGHAPGHKNKIPHVESLQALSKNTQKIMIRKMKVMMKVQKIMYIQSHKGETHCPARGCDMQLILLVLPFVLFNFFRMMFRMESENSFEQNE